jgi:hypothetical protein
MSEFKFHFDIISSPNEKVTSESDATIHQPPLVPAVAPTTASFERTTDESAADDDKEKTPKNVKILQIPLLVSKISSLPEEWKRDRLVFSENKSTITAASDINNDNNLRSSSSSSYYSIHPREQIVLEKIDIHQQPIRGQPPNSCKGGENAVSNEDKTINAKKDSDLIPGYYEGGLKLWECSIDLCNYLSHLIQINHEDVHNVLYCHGYRSPTFHQDHVVGTGGRVLELGCGHGLPGCLLLQELFLRRREQRQNEQKEQQMQLQRDNDGGNDSIVPKDHQDELDFKVVFSDYNEFVLRDVTLPNILLNCHFFQQPNNGRQPLCDATLNDLEQHCVLVAGDWLALSQLLLTKQPSQEEQHESTHSIPLTFDLILAAETTYTVKSANETAYLILNHLEPYTGVAFVAMKRYYFGVGGGSDAFCSACHRYGLETELVKVFQDGKSNIRDLWRVHIQKI